MFMIGKFQSPVTMRTDYVFLIQGNCINRPLTNWTMRSQISAKHCAYKFQEITRTNKYWIKIIIN